MAGVEAITAIQLIDACIGITKTIIDIGRAVGDAQGLPPKLRALVEQLPAIDSLLESARERCEEGKVTGDASRNLEPILRQCEEALGGLRDIFRKACPKDEENRGQRLWKGATTVFLGRNSQLQKFMGTIQDNLKLLEQREIYVIGDKLDEIWQLTEALAQDDSSKYTHSGAGHIIANEGGNPTNYFGGSGNSRQVINPGNYYEGSTSIIHLPPEQSETPPNPSSNVPFRRDPDFVERATLNGQLCEKLSIPAGRAALVGFGGAGKSRLAVEFARALRQRAPQTWVFWIHASSVARFEQSVQDVADQLRLYGRQDSKTDLLLLLRNWLRDETKGKWLIVLDNADDASFLLEPPIAADGLKRTQRRIDYIPSCDHGSMIITTRRKSEALKLVYESDIIDVLPMSNCEAVALLEKKLGKFGSQAEKQQLVANLDCIPLAISHAAAYILRRTPRCSVHQYCEALEQSRTSRTSLLRQDFVHPGRDAQESNSILLTWQISFETIYSTKRSAADLLSLMSFCDRLAIPEILLCGNNQGMYLQSGTFEEDIITLRNFSFISATTNAQTWEMHRLVQDATQMWLDDHRRLDKFLNQFIHRLYMSFPTGQFDNWPLCQELFPHTKCMGDQQPTDKEAQLEWASVMHNSARYAREKGSFIDALAMAEASLDVTLDQLGEEHDSTLASMAMVASVQQLGGQWKEAEDLWVKVIETTRTLLGPEHPHTLDSMGGLAYTYQDQGRWKEAEELKVKVMETTRALFGPEHINTLLSMDNLASIYLHKGRWKEAEELEVKVVEILKRLLGSEHPHTLGIMVNLASSYRDQGRWKEAEELQVKLITTTSRVLGPEHPHTLVSKGNLASTYKDQGRWKEAEELEAKVMETMRKVLGLEHPHTLTSMSGLAFTFRNQGRWKEAEELDMRVIETRTKLFGLDHPHTLMTMGNLAFTYQNQGRWEEAEKLQVTVMETMGTMLGMEHPHTLRVMASLVSTYLNQSRWAEAEALQEQVVGGCEKFYGLQNSYTLEATSALVYIQRKRKLHALRFRWKKHLRFFAE